MVYNLMVYNLMVYNLMGYNVIIIIINLLSYFPIHYVP